MSEIIKCGQCFTKSFRKYKWNSFLRHVVDRSVYVCAQVSQYTFAMCSYRERKADPTEMLQLDGFTVDYCEPLEGL